MTTKFEIVASIEAKLGKPTAGLWKADKGTLEAIDAALMPRDEAAIDAYRTSAIRPFRTNDLTLTRVQDWEFCEDRGGGEYYTVDIQIDTEAEAIAAAQAHANKTGLVCYVNTSVRIVDVRHNSVEDREMVTGAEPIKIVPAQHANVKGSN